MKKIIALSQIIALFIVLLPPVYAQQQKFGSINGVVVDKEEKDKDKNDEKRALEMDIKSDVPIDTVIWNDVGDLKLQKKALPDGWDVKKDGNKIIINGETPTRHFQGGFEVPKDSHKKLDDILKKGVSYEFKFGSLNYGLHPVEVKKGKPTNPVNPNDAAEIPETVRIGNAFSIKVKEGFKDGVWNFCIGDKCFEEYRESPQDIDLDKVNKLLNDPQFINGDKTAREEYDKLFERVPSNTNGSPSPYRTFFVPDGVIPDGTPIPPELKVGLTYDSPFGERTVNGTAKTKVLPDFPDNNGLPNLAPPRLIDCAPKIFDGYQLCVCGYFPNLFTRGKLLVDGKPLGRPAAGSTDMVSFYPTGLAPGRHVITWDLSGFDEIGDPEIIRENPSATEKVEFVVLGVQASIDQNQLWKGGKSTTLRFNILGTDEKIQVQLTNTTPQIIDMQGGVSQIATTSGGISGNGFTREVKGIERGNFNITYSLTTPPCPCNPAETEKAAQTVLTSTNPPDNPKTPENQPNDQPKKKRRNCEQLQSECKETADQLARVKREFDEVLGFEVKPNEAGSSRESFINKLKEDAKKVYEPLIRELEIKLLACYQLYQDCRLSQPTKPLDLSEDEDECEQLKGECDKLKLKFNELAKDQAKEQDACKGNNEEVKKCFETIRAKYNKLAEDLQNQLKDCQDRLEKCRNKETSTTIPPKVIERPFEPVKVALLPTKTQNEQKKTVDCDTLRREYREAQNRLDKLEKELIKAIEGAKKFASDPERAKNQAEIAAGVLQPQIDAAKKKASEARKKLEDNCES